MPATDPASNNEEMNQNMTLKKTWNLEYITINITIKTMITIQIIIRPVEVIFYVFILL